MPLVLATNDIIFLLYYTFLSPGQMFVFAPAVREMQQIYDMWLSLTAHDRQEDGAMLTQPVPGERCIIMPTDYAEPMVCYPVKSKI